MKLSRACVAAVVLCGMLSAVGGVSEAAANQSREVTLTTICLLEGEKYRSRDYVLSMIEKACARPDSDLVVTPHMPFLAYRTGHPEKDLSAFAELARKYGTYLAVAMTEVDGERRYATSVLLDRSGNIVFTSRKTHRLADDDISLGDELKVFQTDFGTIGATIGTDFYFPEIYEVLRLKGAEVLLWHHHPERFRDHSTWQTLLMARALDSHAWLVTAHYADPKPYLTARYSSSPGSAFGRSMVINRVGISVADTGIQDGIASATANLDHRANPGGVRSENIFYVQVCAVRDTFAALAEPYTPPQRPQYAKRTARLAVINLGGDKIWRDDAMPEALFAMLDKVAQMKPDIILASEQQATVAHPTTQQAMKIIGDKARAMNAYICIGGLRYDDTGSTAHLWDRDGNMVWKQPIHWPRGLKNPTTYDTDFARISAHTCGDMFAPFLDRTLALMGAELILDPSLMWGPNGEYNQQLLRARAADNGIWMAVSHCNSSDPALRGFIADPYGQIVASTPFDTDSVVCYDIDFDKQRVYYEGVHPRPSRGTKQIQSFINTAVVMPLQKEGWRDMIFSCRRPELYSIIPTVNDIVRQYTSR